RSLEVVSGLMRAPGSLAGSANFTPPLVGGAGGGVGPRQHTGLTVASFQGACATTISSGSARPRTTRRRYRQYLGPIDRLPPNTTHEAADRRTRGIARGEQPELFAPSCASPS